MILAVDANISNADIRALIMAGHMVVVIAEHSEDDEAFVERALAMACDGIVSKDQDIPNILDKLGNKELHWFGSRKSVETYVRKIQLRMREMEGTK